MDFLVYALWGVFTGAIVMGSFYSNKKKADNSSTTESQNVVVVTETEQTPNTLLESVSRTQDAIVFETKNNETSVIQAVESANTELKEAKTKVETVVANADTTVEAIEKNVFEQYLLNADGTPKTYIVQRGEYLTQIANRFYGDSRFWPYILEVNRDKFTTPEGLQADMEIKLPNTEYFDIDANSSESIEKAKTLISKYLQ